jgi:hypothetical protein
LGRATATYVNLTHWQDPVPCMQRGSSIPSDRNCCTHEFLALVSPSCPVLLCSAFLFVFNCSDTVAFKLAGVESHVRKSGVFLTESYHCTTSIRVRAERWALAMPSLAPTQLDSTPNSPPSAHGGTRSKPSNTLSFIVRFSPKPSESSSNPSIATFSPPIPGHCPGRGSDGPFPQGYPSLHGPTTTLGPRLTTSLASRPVIVHSPN